MENNGWQGIGIQIISMHKINHNARREYSSQLDGKRYRNLSQVPI